MADLKIAVAGMGHGRSLVSAFNEYIHGSEVVVVCDLVEAYVRSAAQELGIKRWTCRYEDLLADRDIDVIVISTPCHLHGRQTLAALDADKHVFVEVPMVNDSLETLWKIVHMSERRNLKVQMDNQFRWMAHSRHMKSLIEQDKLGEIYYVETEYVHNIEPGIVREIDGSPSFRSGLGQVCQGTLSAGGGLYAVDTAYWLLGEQFTEVFAYGNRKNMPARNQNDHEVALFKTPSGAIARVVCSKGPKRPIVEYQAVYGTRGTLETSGRLPPPETGHGLYGSFGVEASQTEGFMWMYDLSVSGMPSSAKVAAEHGAGTAKHGMTRLDIPALAVSADAARSVGHGGVEVLSGLDLVEAIREDRQPMGNVYESARSCAGAICAVRSMAEGWPIRVPEVFNRAEEVRRFAPLPFRSADSATL